MPWAQMNGNPLQEWEPWSRIWRPMPCTAMQCIQEKGALSILTMTDNVVTGKSFRAEERMEGNRPMIELALETAYSDWRERQ